MQRYVVRRFMQGWVVLFILAVGIFVAGRATGDPLNVLLPDDATQEDRVHLARVLGLDQPYPVQFAIFIRNALKGDFGISFRTKRPAIELYVERIPNTAKLLGLSMTLAIIFPIPLGVVAALRRRTIVDQISGAIAVLGIAVPHFWLGIVFIEIFAVRLGWLPASGMKTPLSYVLPAVTLSTSIIAGYMRLIRSSMLEVLDREFIKLARIKGVSEMSVVWKHCLRNALIPAVSFGGVYLAIMIGGTIVVETIFAWPGVGRLAYTAVMTRDFPVIQMVVVINGFLIVLINLAIDVLYAYLDPRVRYD